MLVKDSQMAGGEEVLSCSDGKRYVDPALSKQQGNLARQHYFDSGELGDK